MLRFRLIAWIASAAAACVGFAVLYSSFETYHEWQVHLELGDHSGAELPETEFWVKLSVSLPLIVLGSLGAGRLSCGRPDDSASRP